MTARLTTELAKQLLVACDQSYSIGGLEQGTPLDYLDDQTDRSGDYGMQEVYRTAPQFMWEQGYTIATVIADSNTGGKVAIYQNAKKEVIVAFAGTDGANAQDWVANTQHLGWNQWRNLKPQVLGTITALNPTAVHFTGQSLGGALAQYAAYSYVVDSIGQRPAPFDKSMVTLTTFNGLGAVWGLNANGGYDSSVLIGIGEASHYVVKGDLVARLGGGHIGADGHIVMLDWSYLGGSSVGKPMSITDAHRIETAFYTHIDTDGGQFASFPTPETPLQGGNDAINWAGAIGNLLNDQKTTPAEALFRLIAGIGGSSLLSNPAELDEVLQAAVETQHEAGKLSSITYNVLSTLNLGWISKFLFLSKPGFALTIGSLLAAATVQAVDKVTDWINGAFQWLHSILPNIGSSPEIPTADSSAAAVLKLKTALINCPEAFSGADRARGQLIADALGDDQPREALIHLAFSSSQHTSETALLNEVMSGARYASLSHGERGKLLMSVAEAYGTMAVDTVKENPTLLAEVVVELKQFNQTDLAIAIAKTNPDYTGGGSSGLSFAVLGDFGERKVFTDAILDGLKQVIESAASLISNAALASELTESGDDALAAIAATAQAIAITPGIRNPMDIAGSFDPNATENGQVSEGKLKFYTLYLAYPAGEGGQKIKLTLQGSSAGSFALMYQDTKTTFDSGSIEVTVPAGSDRLGIALLSEDDYDQPDLLTLKAQLLDGSGAPTHVEYTELTINLDATDEAQNGGGRTIVGDRQPEDMQPNEPGVQEGHDDLDNIKVTANPEPDRADTLKDDTGDDRIEGKGGRDTIDAQRGGADLILAGDDSDIVYGGDGDDRIYGGTAEIPLDVAIEQGRTQNGSGEKGDWLNGANGNDLVAGTVGNDALYGGRGDDILVGGAGDDTINGDDDYTASSFDWEITQLENPFGCLQGPLVNRNEFPYKAGKDVLYGGSGNDRVNGLGFDDVIYGDAGDDTIAGGDDSDILIGGIGNDQLTGGFGVPVWGDGSFVMDSPDYIDGGDGNDWAQGEGGDDQLIGGAGDDELWGDTHTFNAPEVVGNDYLDGGAGTDKLMGQGGGDVLLGGDGNDQLFGDADDTPEDKQGDDYAEGGNGDDYLRGQGGNDTLIGGDGADVLHGEMGADELSGGDGEDQIWGLEDADRIDGGDDLDLLYGGDGNDRIDGGAGPDQLEGDAGDDYLLGGDGIDRLSGGEGNDTLIGGGGKDDLCGGPGSDTYLFDADEIYTDDEVIEAIRDSTGENTVVFGGGISPDDVECGAQALENSLVISIGGPNTRLFIADGISGAVSTFTFANGQSYTHDRLFAAFGTGIGTATAANGVPHHLGGKTADTFSTTTDNGVYSGGKGADAFTVAGGGNLWQYSPGDGSDSITVTARKVDAQGNPLLNTVRFAAGIAATDLSLGLTDGAPRVAIGQNPNDTLTIHGFNVDAPLTGPGIDRFEFADGTVLTWAQLLERGVAVSGTAGDDILSGTALADLLDGGAGNDQLSGGRGDDTYRIGRSDGNDTIDNTDPDTAAVDTLVFKAGIRGDDVSLAREGDDLGFRIAAGGRVTVKNYYAGAAIDRVVFADGTTWGASEIAARVPLGQLTEDADNFTGSPYPDTLDGLGGNDQVRGMGGADRIAGGTGNDTLWGGDGDDMLLGDGSYDQLDGGAGNDTLEGGADGDTLTPGAGGDTVRFGRGDGNDNLNCDDAAPEALDVLILGPNIRPEDIALAHWPSAASDDLMLDILTDSAFSVGGRIVMRNYFGNDGAAAIDEIRFVDGAVWRLADVKQRVTTGTPLSDSIIAFSSDDAVHGLGGWDTVYGGAGNDLLYGDDGNDTLNGEGGNDTLNGGADNDMVNGGVGDDALDGGAGSDTLGGGDGNDTLAGGAGNDSLLGGAGDDTYLFAPGMGLDRVTESGGSDCVVLATGVTPASLQLLRSAEAGAVADLVLVVGSGDQLRIAGHFDAAGDCGIERIVFADGTIWGSSEIMALAGSGGAANAMVGTAGDDSFTVDHVGDTISEQAGQGSDTVLANVTYTLPVNVENLTLTGVLAINGAGNGLANVLTGNDSDNTLDGGGGADTLRGGNGNDTYLVDSDASTDVVVELPGEGVDTVVARYSFNLPNNVENLTSSGAVWSSVGSTWLTGNAADNVIDASRSQDRIFVDGGTGADTMIGGSGINIFFTDNPRDLVIGRGGESEVRSTVTFTLPEGVKILTLLGDSNIDGTGSSSNNMLNGNEWANRLDGAAGSDTLNGNGGNDTLAGGARDDYLDGGAGNDVVRGDDGNDTLECGIGDDLLQGGIGNDIYRFGRNCGRDMIEENDAAVGNSDQVQLAFGLTPEMLAVRRDGDDLRLSILGTEDRLMVKGYFAGDAHRVESVLFLSGSLVWDDAALLARLAVNNPPELAQSPPSQEVIIGSPFSYTAPLTVFFDPDGDALTYTATQYDDSPLPAWLTFDPATRTFSGTPASQDLSYLTLRLIATDSGGTSAFAYFNVDVQRVNSPPVANMAIAEQTATRGMAFSFTVPTDTFSDPDGETLEYQATLESGAALPAWLALDQATGVFSGTPGSGDVGQINVRVEAFDYYGLAVGTVFALSIGNNLTGTAGNDTLNGSVYNDILNGDAGNDTLDGKAGADRLIGGAGNDIFVVDQAGDTVVEEADAGSDTVKSPIGWTLGANVENLTLTGAAVIDSTGNALANILTGNIANNRLDGGVGADTLKGGKGDDAYVIDDVGDKITENTGEGADVVESTVSHTLATNVETLVLLGAGSIDGTGNASNNMLSGNTANNTLDGKVGADTMVGGAGDDTYVVNNAGDIVTEAESAGIDTVKASLAWVLGANVENLVLTGSAAINGSGNAAGNLLRGNSAANTLDGGTGFDLIEGGSGNDTLSDTAGGNLFNGGAGSDTLTGGTGADLLIGGTGADAIITGGGNDVVVFNKGGGLDAVTLSTGTTATIALGGGIGQADIKLKKNSNDLVLSTATGDGLTLKNWYDGTSNQNVASLQWVAEAATGYDPASANVLLNRKVVCVDFLALVSVFDAARAANAGLTTWSASGSLAATLRWGSDTSALGGDLAYQFGKAGNLATVGSVFAVQSLTDPQFGILATALVGVAAMQEGAPLS